MVRKLHPMPTCCGGHLDTTPCRVRPVSFLVGEEYVGDRQGLVYAAVCPIHLEDVRAWLSVPHGVLEVEYTKLGWDTIVGEIERDPVNVWELGKKAG